ncbi:uncharacterized protein LOC134154651 [Rhea pennata]|uniref:uncharacterized protein LOC134154651 n=1 Tax=Rhea pennata TaxID=8795 RepID=UPI002E25FDC1
MAPARPGRKRPQAPWRPQRGGRDAPRALPPALAATGRAHTQPYPSPARLPLRPPAAGEPEVRGEGPRWGSLCDRRCAAINDPHGDLPSASHPHAPTPARLSPAVVTHQQHLNEVPACESCGAKTTLTAESAVEANKLFNDDKFGFKKWKRHATARPWEDRSEIRKELYSNLNVIRGFGGSTVTLGSVLYALLFGWWLTLLYVLVAAEMFLTVVGAPYGRLCRDLGSYFLWPFSKVIQRVEGPAAEADGTRETSALLGGPAPGRWCPADPGYRQRAAAAAEWLCLGYPALALAHGLVCFVAWLLFFLISVTKMSTRTAHRVLLPPPERVRIRRPRMTNVPLEAEVIKCCYRAINACYYKYAVDGINVFAVNLLLLVVVTLVLGYVDGRNWVTSSPVKFTLALLSIMPLSYYIGMAIASISVQSNVAVGAVVNATFGSITELTFYITALIKGAHKGSKCYEEIVKAELTGTLVGCVLLVLGLCTVIGGIRHQEQRFNSRSAGVSSALLFLSVGGVFAPMLFSKVYGRLVCGECHNITQNALGHYLCKSCHFDLVQNNSMLYYSHVQPLVYTVSLLLPAAYLIGLFFTLKTHSHIYDIHISDCHRPSHHHSAVVHWSRWRALVILLLNLVDLHGLSHEEASVAEHVSGQRLLQRERQPESKVVATNVEEGTVEEEPRGR